MEPAQKRAAMYLDPRLHNALKLQLIDTSISMSALVNQAVRDAIAEDAADITACEERIDEPVISFSEMVKRLQQDGRI